MNEHVQAAKKQDKSPEGEVPAPEFDAMTWGAEETLKAMVEYQCDLRETANHSLIAQIRFGF